MYSFELLVVIVNVSNVVKQKEHSRIQGVSIVYFSEAIFS